jgi:hypothetical protein
MEAQRIVHVASDLGIDELISKGPAPTNRDSNVCLERAVSRKLPNPKMGDNKLPQE